MQIFNINGKEILIFDATDIYLTYNNRSWKTPVMMTPYLKHETILDLNFLKQSNTIIKLGDYTVKSGTDLKRTVLNACLHLPTSKYLCHSNGLIPNRRTNLLFIVTFIMSISLTAVSLTFTVLRELNLQ